MADPDEDWDARCGSDEEEIEIKDYGGTPVGEWPADDQVGLPRGLPAARLPASRCQPSGATTADPGHDGEQGSTQIFRKLRFFPQVLPNYLRDGNSVPASLLNFPPKIAVFPASPEKKLRD